MVLHTDIMLLLLLVTPFGSFSLFAGISPGVLLGIMTRGTQLIAITAPFLAFATVVLFLRLYTRFGILGNAGAEDVLVGFAWVGCISIPPMMSTNLSTDLRSHSVRVTYIQYISPFTNGSAGKRRMLT